MEGVTVLNSFYQVTVEQGLLLFCLCMSFGTTGFIFLIEGILDSGLRMAIGVILIAIAVCSIIVTPRTEHYQVIIDPNLSWTEFTEKYEVIRTDGRIITVIKKEN